MNRIRLCYVLLALLLPLGAFAQQEVQMPVQISSTLLDGDSVPMATYSPVYIFPKPTFKSKRQQKQYDRLVRNVKKVLPIAKEVNQIIIETYESMEGLPSKKARKEHVKKVEHEILETYKPRMKKLTFSQGKLLIKLIDRETNQSAYDAVKAFAGPFRAGFWQAFAWMFGASLKKEYDPEGEDRLTEQVVLQVEAGQL
jgi:hypothetical protein